MRDRYPEIRQRGADVVLIGTGDVSYARDFVASERLPFPVLVDDDARAARAARLRRVGMFKLFDPASWSGARRAWQAGHRIGRSGKRVDQLGATFVLGPGPVVRYAHYDAHTADHAPLEEVFAALGSRP